MKIVIDIPEAPMEDYRDLFYTIHGMAAREGLFDDKKKSRRALSLKVVLDILDGVINGTLLPKGHGRLIDADRFLETNDCFGYIEDMEVEYFNKVTPTIIEADKAESEDKK